jgi:hypothetical protein
MYLFLQIPTDILNYVSIKKFYAKKLEKSCQLVAAKKLDRILILLLVV